MRKIVNDFNKDLVVQVNVCLLKFKLKVYSPLKKIRSFFKKNLNYLSKIQKIFFKKKEKPFRYSLLIISFFFMILFLFQNTQIILFYTLLIT